MLTPESITPKIGFGAWQIGGPQLVEGRPNGWNVGSIAECKELLFQALDLGISFFDTAQSYGDGRSELILGEFAQAPKVREQITICTKVALQNLSELPNRVQASLQNLRTDSIDVLLLHNPEPDLISAETQSALQELVQKGWIRSFGVSARTLDDFKLATSIGLGNTFEWNYSMLDSRIEDWVNHHFIQNGQHFIGRSPLYRGLITDYFHAKGPDVEFHDVRAKLSKSVLTWAHSAISSLIPMAREFQLSLSELALAYACSHPHIQVAVPGISKPTHLDSIQKVLNLRPETLKNIRNCKVLETH